jgi:uncharacterized protein (DUF983 family)
MGALSRPHIFTCPRCKREYWGGPEEPLPDCPHCGYDYRTRDKFRLDLLFLMILIMAMVGFLLLSSSYRRSGGPPASSVHQGEMPEKLPGR